LQSAKFLRGKVELGQERTPGVRAGYVSRASEAALA
jgi:hypothetical protein